MDEWIFLTTSEHFFEDPLVRAAFRRYAIIVDKCKNDVNIENCAPVCREFNINKFNYMWDGESDPLLQYVEKFKKFLEIF